MTRQPSLYIADDRTRAAHRAHHRPLRLPHGVYVPAWLRCKPVRLAAIRTTRSAS